MAKGIRGAEARYGWLFTAPAILIIGVFLVLPIFLAVYVSFSNWNGLGSPLGNSSIIGTGNYEKILLDDGLARKDFGISRINEVMFLSASVFSLASGGPRGSRFTRSKVSPRLSTKGSWRWPTNMRPTLPSGSAMS